MNWSKNISFTEYAFIIAFVLIYGLYLLRVILTAKKMGVSARSIFLKVFLRSFYFGLLIVGMLGPVFGDSTKILQATGRDLFVAVDLSKSMDVDDIQPSRLEKVKFELLKMIDKFESDRLGIIIFTTEAFVHLPLTFDHEAQKIFIQSLNTDMISQSGTNLNAVFELVNKKMIENPVQKSKTKGLILITDGEDFGEIDQDLLKKIRYNQIKTIVVGVGTRAGGKIMEDNQAKKEDGEIVISKLKNKFLKDLSISLRGEYIEVSQYQTEFTEVSDAVNRIENSIVDRRNFFVSANKYFYFLLAAIALICLDILWAIQTMKL
jgi:Ca-activated chloride channel homolog